MSPNLVKIKSIYYKTGRCFSAFFFVFGRTYVPDFFLFFKKALNEVKAFGHQLSFKIF